MKNCIGIRKENIDNTERRVPLIPDQVKRLIDLYKIRVIVEPSERRCFKEEEYIKAGAEISTDLSDCNIIFGVKEVPMKDLIENKTYVFFSHTIKGQDYNMPLLQKILDLKVNLFDYELIRNENGRRLIFFGNFAGYAGMIDSLWVQGQRLLWEGIENPFSEIKPAWQYDSLADAKQSIKQVGKKIQKNGLDPKIAPYITGFTGYGRVSKGAQEIFDLLPHVKIMPEELPKFYEDGKFSNGTLYKVEFRKHDMFAPKDKDAEYSWYEFHRYPERYYSLFEKYAPYLNMVINGIYWEPRFPRLLSKDFLKSLYEYNVKPRLSVIGDITCDIGGSIETTVKATLPENPVYVYDASTDEVLDGWEGNGPVTMAVDKLPTELPNEASEAFGDMLFPYVEKLAKANFNQSFDKIEIDKDFQKANITNQGNLTKNFEYLQESLDTFNNKVEVNTNIDTVTF